MKGSKKRGSPTVDDVRAGRLSLGNGHPLGQIMRGMSWQRHMEGIPMAVARALADRLVRAGGVTWHVSAARSIGAAAAEQTRQDHPAEAH